MICNFNQLPDLERQLQEKVIAKNMLRQYQAMAICSCMHIQ